MSKAINETSSYDYLIETISKDGIDDATEALVVISINHKDVRVKLDTGADVDVMPKRVYDQVTSEDKLKTTTLKLHGYGGDNIPILGSMQMKCKYKNTIKYVDFFIVETNSRTVLSLQTCQAMGLVKVLHEVKDADKQLDKK